MCVLAGKQVTPGELLTALEGAPLDTVYLDAAGQEKGAQALSCVVAATAAAAAGGRLLPCPVTSTGLVHLSAQLVCLRSHLECTSDSSKLYFVPW
jgi:hypothetical protein